MVRVFTDGEAALHGAARGFGGVEAATQGNGLVIDYLEAIGNSAVHVCSRAERVVDGFARIDDDGEAAANNIARLGDDAARGLGCV
jgi:hypothetical protein